MALFFQWFIVVTGATVRLTGSGLGCPNWPTCTTTRAVPEVAFHPMVEFLNRITATPTLLAALVALWVCWRLERPEGAGPRRDLRIATVEELDLQVEEGKVVAYRTKVKLSFKYHQGED